MSPSRPGDPPWVVPQSVLTGCPSEPPVQGLDAFQLSLSTSAPRPPGTSSQGRWAVHVRSGSGESQWAKGSCL
eukprot:9500355-Pyramimonas_sp.AAC.1